MNNLLIPIQKKQSSENVTQKMNLDLIDKNYKIFTNQFDEIAKAETLRDCRRNIKITK